MNLQIVGDHYDISPKTRNLIDEKITTPIDKLLTNFSPDAKTVHLRIGQDKFKNLKVSFDLTLPGKEHIFATATHHLLESALIDLQQEVEKQIKKYKERLTP